MSYIRKADRCRNCHGTGEDGDPGDAAGVGAWIGVCGCCNGTGLQAVADEVRKGWRTQALLTEALDLVPRIRGDDPMAPTLADWCRKVRDALDTPDSASDVVMAWCAKCQSRHGLGAPCSASVEGEK